MFAALAAHGHTYPSIPLALAARNAGHDVVFVAGQQFLPTLRRAGLAAEPAGMSMAEAFAGVAPSAEQVGRVIGAVLPRRMAADLAPLLAEHRPDAVVHDVGTLGAPIAAAVAGIPALGHTFGRIFANTLSESIVSSFDALAAEFELDPAALTASPVLDICPESVQSQHFLDQADRVPLRPVAWSECGALVERTPGRPLVYLTLGTVFATAAVLRQAVDGLAALPVDVLVAAGPALDPAALGDVPDHVRVAAWVPQAAVLPHVDLVVHHGGSGTMLGAFAAGRPQLLLPHGADQFTNAEAVVAAGAGARLLPADLSPDAVAVTARALLADDAVRDAARRLAGEIAAMPPPEDVAARLPALIG